MDIQLKLGDIKTEMVDPKDLVISDNNPRTISAGQFFLLKQSLEKDPEFLKLRPIIANIRFGQLDVIAGSMRARGVLALNWALCPVIKVDVDKETAERWMLKDNIHQGEWNMDELANRDLQMLKDAGLKDKELKKITEILDTENNPEIPFTPELMEEQNYLVFYFNQALDWNVVKEFFKIAPAQAIDSREGYERIGTGRVVDGKKLLTMIRNNEV